MYNHKEIEAKWQANWVATEAFRTPNRRRKPKFYVLDMFPYPSGSGLHVGHPEGYTATDIIARYKRLKGFDVLHPMGWDAFGLPAEQYAIQTGNHPAQFTQQNIDRFRTQLKSLGFSYDYAKEIDTTDPQYYRWTQWIFVQLYKHNLAEIREINVNWCEELGTVLANEEVLTDDQGRSVSERGNFLVVKKPMRQWVLRITAYANKLFSGLDDLEWPASLIALQKNWIRNEDGSLHLEDWVFSRQRYWGEPFPMAFDASGATMVIDDLPVKLPEMKEIKPSGNGESPLANNKEWLYFWANGKEWRRETNTMPQWAGSSWYYLAYILKNPDGSYLPLDSPQARKRMAQWLPVDLYIGGQEHAVLHLLYARFWHRVLYDLGFVPTPEPFRRVVNQGMILGVDGQKMSKSRGNVINPDDIVTTFGADTLRVYEMFAGPLEDVKAWNEESIAGIRRWLDRVDRLFTLSIANAKAQLPMKANDKQKAISALNCLIRDVTDDLEKLKFNTAISKMMVYINTLYRIENFNNLLALRKFAIILSPFAPHLAEELLARIGYKPLLQQQWPQYNSEKIIVESIVIAVQINGKLRGTLTLSSLEESAESIISMARQLPSVANMLQNKRIIKELYIAGKIVNFVTA